MNAAFLMSARARIVYSGQTTIHGAILGKPDNDALVVQLEDACEAERGKTVRSPLDAIELLIAEKVDAGEVLPVTNAEGYGAAQWLAKGDLGKLPDPIPRAFVLYLAAAWAQAGKYPSVKAALSDILGTRSFA